MICTSCTQRLIRPSLLSSTSRLLQTTAPRRTLALLAPTLRLPSSSSLTSLPTSTSSHIRPSPMTLGITSLSTPSSISSGRNFSTSAPTLAPRDTYNMTHRVRKRRHGFLSRIKTRKGRAILSRRRAKGRQSMSH